METDAFVDAVVSTLNELVKLDPVAMRDLMDRRVSCNAALADHPTVQVLQTDAGCKVGPLGLLNGLLGIMPDGDGPIRMVIPADGSPISFVARSRDV